MRYKLEINLAALNELGSSIDLEDAVLLDYLYWLCSSPSIQINKMRKIFNGEIHTWFNYGTYIKETPILRGKNKSSVTKRIKTLEDEGFISTEQDEKTFKKYVKLLPKVDCLYTNTVYESKRTRSDLETLPFTIRNIDKDNIDKDNNITMAKAKEKLSKSNLPIGIASKTGKKEKSPERKKLDADILTIMAEFNKRNKAVTFGHKGHRTNAANLLKSYKVEHILEMIEEIDRTKNMEYVPVITTPSELFYKLEKFKLFLNKE